MPLSTEGLGYCPAVLRPRLEDVLAEELAAVEAACGRPLRLSVTATALRGIEVRHGSGDTVVAEVLRHGCDEMELALNLPALEGVLASGSVGRTVPSRTRRRQADRVWRMLRWQALLPASDGEGWEATASRDARTAARGLRGRFRSRRAWRQWALGSILCVASLDLAEDRLRGVLAHELGHVWYEAARLPWGAEREPAVAAAVAAMPAPATLRGTESEHEAAAEAWALHRLSPGLIDGRRPDLAAWLGSPGAGGTAILDAETGPGGQP